MHSRLILHGDLTGVSTISVFSISGLLIIPSYQSNVLIDDGLHARLCDFGLSTFLRECQDDDMSKSIQSVYTSHLPGSVRWADASLFRSLEEDKPPIVGTPNDIYSFGSVMLEVTIFSAPMFPAINISYRYYQAACRIITFGLMRKLLSNCTRALNRGGLLPLSWMKINGALFKNAGKTRLRIGHLYLRLWN